MLPNPFLGNPRSGQPTGSRGAGFLQEGRFGARSDGTGIFQAGVADALGIRTGRLQLPGKATGLSAGRNRRHLQNAPFQGGLSQRGWNRASARSPRASLGAGRGGQAPSEPRVRSQTQPAYQFLTVPTPYLIVHTSPSRHCTKGERGALPAIASFLNKVTLRPWPERAGWQVSERGLRK